MRKAAKHKRTRERHAPPDVNPPASRTLFAKKGHVQGGGHSSQGRRNGVGMGERALKVNDGWLSPENWFRFGLCPQFPGASRVDSSRNGPPRTARSLSENILRNKYVQT